MKSSIYSLSLLIAAGIFTSACGGGESDSTPTPAESPAPTEEAAPADIPDRVEFTIEANDQMQFDTKKLEVYSGQTVSITLKNVGELPVETMGHNLTILQKGIEHMEYGTAAMSHKDNGYQVPGREDDVLISTQLLGPGESETIEFTAPESGIYKYLCTFPGHAGLMNGTMLVRG